MLNFTKKIIVSILLLTLLSAISFADDYHYVNSLVGVRAAGLGGAYTAISDDASGMYYNPAGIVYAPTNSISASVNAYSISKKTYKDALKGTDGSTHDWTQESKILLPNYFGIVQTFGKLKIGFSYAVPDSVQRSQQQTFSNIKAVKFLGDQGVYIDQYNININDNDKTYNFGPSFALSINQNLSVGLTVYGYYRDQEIIRNQLLRLSDGQFELTNAYLNKTEWGVKPILGIMWDPTNKFSIGLTVSKIFVTSSDKSEQITYRGLTNTYGNTALTAYGLDDIYYNYSDSSDKDKFPTNLNLAFAYFPNQSLLFSAELKYYSEADEKEDVINVAIGSEYYFNPNVALRVGFFTDMANTPELSSSKVNQPESVDIYGLSASVSYFTKSSGLTFGMTYGYGEGDAQIISNSTAIQDLEINNFTIFLAASYNY